MDIQRGFTGLRTLAAVVAVSFLGGACGESADPTLPITPGALPTFSVVLQTADSTQLQIVNSGDGNWGTAPNACPVAAQTLVDGSWQHAGYIMPFGGSSCDLALIELPPGQVYRFWLKAPVPDSDLPLRLAAVIMNTGDNSDLTIATAPLEQD